MNITWRFDQTDIDWSELSELYKIAPLGDKSAADLKIVFSNSKFKCFIFDGDVLVGVGRALADGLDCSYIGDVAIHPEYQGRGLGKEVVKSLVNLSQDHNKIILYANPGREGFYANLGFKKMNTAMAIFQNEDEAMKKGVLSEP